MLYPFLSLVFLAILVSLTIPLTGFCQDEQEIEAAQEERESRRWSPERDVRTLQKNRQQNQLELSRQARSVSRALRDGHDASKKAVQQQKARVLNEEIKTRDERVDASENRQLNQARVEQDREVQDAVGFSGTQIIDLDLQPNQAKTAAARAEAKNNAKRREIGFLKEQEGFLLNEQQRLDMMGEPDGAKALEGEVGTVRNRLENLEKPPSTFFPGMPLGNPGSGSEPDQ